MRFADMIRHVTALTIKARPENGLYPNYLNPNTGAWGSKHTSLGALGDSFYEYLLKMWVYHGGRNNPGKTVDAHGRAAFDDAMAAVSNQLVQKSSKSQLLYLAESNNGRLVHKMGHLACFMGGLYGLAAKGAPGDEGDKYMELGKGITNTCHESYARSPAKLGPEAMMFSGDTEVTSTRANERYYILRPETVSFLFKRISSSVMQRCWSEGLCK